MEKHRRTNISTKRLDFTLGDLRYINCSLTIRPGDFRMTSLITPLYLSFYTTTLYITLNGVAKPPNLNYRKPYIHSLSCNGKGMFAYAFKN